MTVTENGPNDPSLNEYIKSCSFFKVDKTDSTNSYLLLPNINSTIYIGLNCSFELHNKSINIEENTGIETTRVFIPSLLDIPHTLTTVGKPMWLQIIFCPLKGNHFINKNTIDPSVIDALSSLVNKGTQNKFELLRKIESFFKTRYTTSHKPNANQIITLLKTGLPITEIASQLKISYRSLYRYIIHRSGLTPSLFLRMLRLSISLEEKKESSSEVDLHFYDAPHYTRECKRFTGYTPTAFKTHFIKIKGNLYQKKPNVHSVQ